MDYRTVIFYLALFLVVGSLAEIYARKKEYEEVKRTTKGRTIPHFRSVLYPVLLLIAAIITAVAARLWH
jgi:hypothetical protein